MVRVDIPLGNPGSQDSPVLNAIHLTLIARLIITFLQLWVIPPNPPQITLRDPSMDSVLRYKRAGIFLLWSAHPEALAQLQLMPFVELSPTLLRVHLAKGLSGFSLKVTFAGIHSPSFPHDWVRSSLLHSQGSLHFYFADLQTYNYLGDFSISSI